VEGIYTAVVFLALLGLIAFPYWRKVARAHKEARQAHSKSTKAGLTEPATLHPKIDILSCIGCGSCVQVCPEAVLALVQGKATIVNSAHCVGHSVCAEVCPVGAITMGFGAPKQGFEIPIYDEHFESNIPGLYIVGELGGVGLIKNAIEQGIKAVNHAAETILRGSSGVSDLVIVGAGPAGIGAALASKTLGLRSSVLEQYDLGGSILHYPRQKLVLTNTVDIPFYGKLKASEISKEELLELFTGIVERQGLNIRTQQKVESITRQSDGMFQVLSGTQSYIARSVVLAIGRRGSPRKLGVIGEELPKVAYRLIDAENYKGRHVLVVGGGDSAIEAAIALARQSGNTVTLSYRKEEFLRIKEKNRERIDDLIKHKKVSVLFRSEVAEIRPQEVVIGDPENAARVIKNDFVFVFAGGELPAAFLAKIGVQFRTEEMLATA
jgi:thioredoxin reductase (NADPH)